MAWPQHPEIQGSGSGVSAGSAEAFPDTRWSLVRALQTGDPAAAEASLHHLCRLYWMPLYGYARRMGRSVEDAEDATQAFLLSLIERQAWERAEATRGRLRTFLLSSMQHFLMNARRDATRQKRDSGRTVPLDVAVGEGLYREAEALGLSPEQAFDRQWAISCLRGVMDDLRTEHTAAGKAALFHELERFLLDVGTDGAEYSAAAARLGMSEGAVKVAVHRLRGRYRQRLVERVAETVDDPSAVGRELEFIISLFSR